MRYLGTHKWIKPGTYKCYGGDKHLFDIVVRPDGTHAIYPVGSAECTVCRQGSGNDCAHFEAR